MEKQNAPIGIFDSGLGGLTVVKEVLKQLPNENIIYIGDTARVPYGNKSPETVIRFTTECVNVLKEQNVKMVVIACNTASSSGIEQIQDQFDFPVVGVVKPGALAAYKSTKKQKVGVIGTERTIKSGSYERAIKALNPDIEVWSKACPLFVPLVEEGWFDNDITRRIIRVYLSELMGKGIDTLVLGCTHYPLLKNTIKDIVGNDIRLVDSAEETAMVVKDIVRHHQMERHKNDNPEHQFFVTDAPEKFVELGEIFLQHKIKHISKIELESEIGGIK